LTLRTFRTQQRAVNVVSWTRQQINGIVCAIVEVWTWQLKQNTGLDVMEVLM